MDEESRYQTGLQVASGLIAIIKEIISEEISGLHFGVRCTSGEEPKGDGRSLPCHTDQ